MSLGIQSLKLNPAINFIASDSQAGEKGPTEIKRNVRGEQGSGPGPGEEAEGGGVLGPAPRGNPALLSSQGLYQTGLGLQPRPPGWRYGPSLAGPCYPCRSASGPEGSRLNAMLPDDPSPPRRIATALEEIPPGPPCPAQAFLSNSQALTLQHSAALGDSLRSRRPTLSQSPTLRLQNPPESQSACPELE